LQSKDKSYRKNYYNINISNILGKQQRKKKKIGNTTKTAPRLHHHKCKKRRNPTNPRLFKEHPKLPTWLREGKSTPTQPPSFKEPPNRGEFSCFSRI